MVKRCKARYALGEHAFGNRIASVSKRIFRSEVAARKELRRQFKKGWGRVHLFVTYDCGKNWVKLP